MSFTICLDENVILLTNIILTDRMSGRTVHLPGWGRRARRRGPQPPQLRQTAHGAAPPSPGARAPPGAPAARPAPARPHRAHPGTSTCQISKDLKIQGFSLKYVSGTRQMQYRLQRFVFQNFLRIKSGNEVSIPQCIFLRVL